MAAKKFLYGVFGFTITIIVIMVAINYWIDLYGLFRPRSERSIKIYSDERTSKYLLAHKYVPNNFDALLLGPSLSANIDTKQIQELGIYNLSMMGANITEQKAVVDKAIESATPKFVIICLHPYLTFDHGRKTGMIDPKEYYGALGSISLYKAYVLKFIRDHNLMPAKYPKDQFNEYGFNNYERLVQKISVEDKIKEQLEVKDAIKATIDSVAWKEFATLIEVLSAKDVRIISYFHPLPRPLFQKYYKSMVEYQSFVDNYLKDKATVIDFNTDAYTFFTSDFTNYIDHGHLSEKGQHFLLKEILSQADLKKR